MPAKRIVVLDSCLRQVWTDSSGRHERRKRRPVGSVPEKCSWVVHCPDHPGEGVIKVGWNVKIRTETEGKFVHGSVREVRGRVVIVRMHGLDEEVDKDLIAEVYI